MSKDSLDLQRAADSFNRSVGRALNARRRPRRRALGDFGLPRRLGRPAVVVVAAFATIASVFGISQLSVEAMRVSPKPADAPAAMSSMNSGLAASPAAALLPVETTLRPVEPASSASSVLFAASQTLPQDTQSPSWKVQASSEPPAPLVAAAHPDMELIPAIYLRGPFAIPSDVEGAGPDSNLDEAFEAAPTDQNGPLGKDLPPVTRHAVTIHRGDSLLGILGGVDIPSADGQKAVNLLEPEFDPRTLQIGSRVEFVIDTPVQSEEDKVPALLLELRIIPRKDKGTAHAWLGGDYSDRSVIDIVDGLAPIMPGTFDGGNSRYLTATVRRNFSEAAREAGASSKDVQQMVKVLEGSIDFNRDVHTGDRVEALISHDEEGKTTIHYVGLRNRKRDLAYYRVDFADGSSGYYDDEGGPYSNLISTKPLGHARVTSNYGYRIHPIRKVRHLHRGTDFRAHTGTPIPAVGNGVVVQMGWRGGYGRYLRIRHNSTFMTAYAHLSNFAKGISVGSQIKRDQVIGYVGSSGLSTGPHLHFEVLRDGKHVDPLKLPRVPAEPLAEERLAEFLELREKMDMHLDANRESRLASLR